MEGPGVWQNGKKKRKEKKLESGKLWGKNKIYTYILIYTYGGTYKYVRWGRGLESSKL